MTNKQVTLNIDTLIQIVKNGGKVKTGVNVFSRNGVLLLDKDILIDNPKPLQVIKDSGLGNIAIDPAAAGGIWDDGGRQLQVPAAEKKSSPGKPPPPPRDVKNRIKNIAELKKEAAHKYKKAKENIKKVISDIRETGGEFDYHTVENTVTDLFSFITKNDNAFSYLTKEIFSYDDYLYHHSINACTIGTAILKKYNEQFDSSDMKISREKMFQISIGYFLHDVGKVLIPDNVLNKAGKLTDAEFALVKTHSYKMGPVILDKNGIDTPEIRNIVKYHHGAIQRDESNCYPEVSEPEKVPIYVKICKLADIYDAMTSKRCYKDAFNPVGVVTEIVRKYAAKDKSLGYLLHAFVKSVGIYPAGSIVHLNNGQLGYILDSEGPLVIPFTTPDKAPMPGLAAPIDMGHDSVKGTAMAINAEQPLTSPTDAFHFLPENLKAAVSS